MQQTKIGTRRPTQKTRAPVARGTVQPTTSERSMGKPAGLCTTCLHREACTFPRTDGQLVQHCGEFAGETRPAAAVAARPPSIRVVETEARTALLGLCSNCDSRDVCRYPKAEGGVWQCDEYR